MKRRDNRKTTAELLQRLMRERNPVTRSVLAQIVGDRIDLSLQALSDEK